MAHVPDIVLRRESYRGILQVRVHARFFYSLYIYFLYIYFVLILYLKIYYYYLFHSDYFDVVFLFCS